jgi:hypothetical protein
MTSRERFEAWSNAQEQAESEPERTYELSEEGLTELTNEAMLMAWQAAERDMLERAIALFNQPHQEYFGENIQTELKELLNEPR